MFSSYYAIPAYKIIKENGELACIMYLPCARPLGKVLSRVISHLCMCVCIWSCPALCNPMDCGPRLLHPWSFPDKNTGACCHFLRQEIVSDKGSNWSLLHWQVDSLRRPCVIPCSLFTLCGQAARLQPQSCPASSLPTVTSGLFSVSVSLFMFQHV